MITGIYEFEFFLSKNGRSWPITVFQKLVCWNPYFYSVLGVRVFWAKFSKKGILGHPPKNKNFLTDNWKAHFLIFFCFCFVYYFLFFVVFLLFLFFVFCRFCCFFVFLFFCFFVFFFLEGLRVRWGGPKGHLTWPSTLLIYFFCVLFFCFFCFCFCFFRGFKGQVRWPEGPPHLALNPPYWFFLVCFFVCFVFLYFFFLFSFLCFWVKKNSVSTVKKGILWFIFECLPLFLLSLFWPSTCSTFSFSVSVSLSLSLVIFFLSSFLSFSFCFLLVPSFSLFLSFSVFFGFVSWKLTASKDSIAKFFFSSILCLFWVSCLVFSFKSLFLIFVFSWYSVIFLFNINVFGFKKHKLRNTNFGSKGELQQNGFFNNLCFATCEKLSFFLPLFWPNFGWCSKNTI